MSVERARNITNSRESREEKYEVEINLKSLATKEIKETIIYMRKKVYLWIIYGSTKIII